MSTTKPQALVVCGRDSFEVQFDPEIRARLAAMVTLGNPMWTDELDSPAARARLATTEIMLTSWGAPPLTAARLAAAPALRAVFHCAGSVRSLASDELWHRKIMITNAADANAIPVAEFTLAAIVLAGKRIPFIAAQARRFSRGWSHIQGLGDLSNYGRTIGIVGFSRIGRRVVELLSILDGAHRLVVDPYADPAEVAAAGAVLVPLPEALERSEILSLHAPGIPQTRHMIGAAELALLPDHATIINTARGSLIDTAALERECATGRIHAILDVTDPEPLPADSVLYELPNVMLTPHLAGSMGSETRRLVEHALEELRRYLDGRPPRAAVNFEDLGISA